MLRGSVALLALVGCGGGSDPAPGGAQPNVLLITLDTVRADYLSVTGSGKANTPRLDAIAAEGAWFTNASSASAVTPVSHASILTGQFQYNHGLRVLHAGSGFRLPASAPSAASVFRAAGYTTGAVHSAFPVSGYFGFDRDFDHFDSFDGALAGKEGGVDGWDVSTLQRRSDDTTQRALKFVEGADAPWFLWIHYWDPHDGAIVPPAEYLRSVPRTPQGQITTDDLYAVEVEYMDEQIGALVDGLRSQGSWDGTVVAITADHGEGLADGTARHGWPFHRVLYQEQIHVPLIVSGPGVPAGGRVTDLVRTVDVAPTLYDLAGVEGPSVDGSTLRSLLNGKADAPRIAYADQVNGYDSNSLIAQKRPQAAFLNSITEWPWKLIWRPHMPEASELFNLQTDALEAHNVIADHPLVVARLLDQLVQRSPWITAPFPVTGDGASGAEGALGALGYATGGGEDGTEALQWAWTCATHFQVREPSAGACPRCGKKMFPVATN
ncbi:MAG: sulfatase [Planctomycetota bacterium]|nr:sulfatase [Planctomycetota bacterium]